jgi:phosphoribosylanthranilate isomerase
MALKVTVKVGRITNLSDARYCAGMGVQLLGFTTLPNRRGYITPEAFQEMRGWFAGPQVVAEVYGIRQGSALDDIMAQYQPDLLEGGLEELNLLSATHLPYVLHTATLTADKLDMLHALQHRPAYIISTLSDDAALAQLGRCAPVLLELPDVNPDTYLSKPVSGFALSGTDEERPGLKNYDSLAYVLERLEIAT